MLGGGNRWSFNRSDRTIPTAADYNLPNLGKDKDEIKGLPAYHRLLLGREHPHVKPALVAAVWNERVLEMEVTYPFGNRLIFCEPVGLLRGSEQVRISRRR